MSIKKPFNLQKWIENNRDLLKPPVANKNLYPEGTDYIVMIVGGPNARKDYHYNETEDLPPKVPHSPGRSEGSIGLVIERVRQSDHKDGLMWFCDKCNHKLHETYFPLSNIENDFLPPFKEYYASEELRTCDNCGHTMETDPRFT
jgi:3-hydroxyanthranilate 3,4-dioxygenase